MTRIALVAVLLHVIGPPCLAGQVGGTLGAPAQARAAGMALHDGALPPGTLTVRIVRGDFSGNRPGVRVALETDGQPAKESTTGADGRAQFAHLPVGRSVRVWATVDGERLSSEAIVLPAESGVRVLLVAGDQFVDGTQPGQVAQLPPLSDAAPLTPGSTVTTTLALVPPAERTPPAQPSADDPGATPLIVMAGLTVLAFVAVVYGQARRRL